MVYAGETSSSCPVICQTTHRQPSALSSFSLPSHLSISSRLSDFEISQCWNKCLILISSRHLGACASTYLLNFGNKTTSLPHPAVYLCIPAEVREPHPEMKTRQGLTTRHVGETVCLFGKSNCHSPRRTVSREDHQRLGYETVPSFASAVAREPNLPSPASFSNPSIVFSLMQLETEVL